MTPFRSPSRLHAGFTLLELLIVLVIVGIAMGFVATRMLPDDRQALQNEAQRIALLMQLARDEAILRNRPVAFESGSESYRFVLRDENRWQPMERDSLLRSRSYPQSPVSLAISPAGAAEDNPFRIVFGREPVDKPFVLTLAVRDARAVVRADGIGHFTVE